MYCFRRTNEFLRFCKHLAKKNQTEHLILRERFYILLEDPYNNTGFLNGPLRGKRSDRNGDIRFIFAICEECRKLGHTQRNSCANCDENPDSTVIFFAAGPRKNIYDR